MGKSKTGRSAVEVAEKQRLIGGLIRAGYSLTEVAGKLGQNPGNIHRHLKAILKDLRIASEEDIRNQRLLEGDRCEQIIKANRPKATSENAPGKFSSQDRIIKAMERKARLLGLDSPTKIAPKRGRRRTL